MTSLNLLSQQNADSDQAAEVSVQRTFILCACSAFHVIDMQWSE